MIKAAMFDTRPYDSEAFERRAAGRVGVDYFPVRLDERTVTLARLLSMPNVIVTSHQAFLTEEAMDGIAGTTVQNIVDFFDGKPIANEVCYRSGAGSPKT